MLISKPIIRSQDSSSPRAPRAAAPRACRGVGPLLDDGRPLHPNRPLHRRLPLWLLYLFPGPHGSPSLLQSSPISPSTDSPSPTTPDMSARHTAFCFQKRKRAFNNFAFSKAKSHVHKSKKSCPPEVQTSSSSSRPRLLFVSVFSDAPPHHLKCLLVSWMLCTHPRLGCSCSFRRPRLTSAHNPEAFASPSYFLTVRVCPCSVLQASTLLLMFHPLPKVQKALHESVFTTLMYRYRSAPTPSSPHTHRGRLWRHLNEILAHHHALSKPSKGALLPTPPPILIARGNRARQVFFLPLRLVRRPHGGD